MTTNDPMNWSTQGADGPGNEELVDVLVQATFATMAVLNGVAADNDLSLTQLRVLAILRDRRVRMSALAGYLGLDRSTMTGLVDRAEKRGLLARAPNPDDGRAVDVFLSPIGVNLADALYTSIERRLWTATDTLTPSERDRLRSLLRRLIVPESERHGPGYVQIERLAPVPGAV